MMLDVKLARWLFYYKKLKYAVILTLVLWLVYGCFTRLFIVILGLCMQGIIVIFLHKANDGYYENILKTKEYDKVYDKNKGVLGDIPIYLSLLCLSGLMAFREYPNVIFWFSIYLCVYFVIEILFALFLKFILLTNK